MHKSTKTSIKWIVKQCFTALRVNRNADEAWLNEDRADRELVSYTQKAMREKLAAARMKGRRGWWRMDACSIEELEALLQKALADKDMISVINYAAMIEVRRITDE